MKTVTTTKLVIDTTKDLHAVIIHFNDAIRPDLSLSRDNIRGRLLEEVERLMQEAFKLGRISNND